MIISVLYFCLFLFFLNPHLLFLFGTTHLHDVLFTLALYPPHVLPHVRDPGRAGTAICCWLLRARCWCFPLFSSSMLCRCPPLPYNFTLKLSLHRTKKSAVGLGFRFSKKMLFVWFRISLNISKINLSIYL